MKQCIYCVFIFVLLFQGCKKGSGFGGEDSFSSFKTEDEKAIYAFGHIMGTRMRELNMSDMELEAALEGVRDGIKNTKPKLKVNEYRPKIGELMQKRAKVISEKAKVVGKVFLEKFLSDGGEKTPSGLAYKVTKEGTGESPKVTDIVKVHYHGTLSDGTVFDSSKERNKPAEFPLNRVIPGWTEGLQLIKKGGSITLVIPSELAYGERGAPPKIPGGATLRFEIELLEIKAAPAPPEEKSSKGKSDKDKK